jgi:glycosyltransferase involved in cell wall biosynthesis
MTSQPLVTIVTPTYNQAGFLAETIESVLAQDYPNIEYIVIDDGSTDATAEVLERYAERVRCLRHDNMGQARTLNKGWELAQGKYIGYLSSDDLLHPTAISELVRTLEANGNIVCAFPDSDLIDARSKVVKRQVCRPFDLEDLIVRQECYIGPGALFRRAAYAVAGGWRPELRLAPDREFWIRLARHGEFHFLPRSLAGYRLHPQSISYKVVSEEVSREYLLVLDEYFARPSLPASIARRKEEAYGHATLLLARNALRAGQFARGLELYRKACLLHRGLASPKVKLTLLRNVVSKPARALYAKLRGAHRP